MGFARHFFSPDAARRWIALIFPRLKNQSNRAKSTIDLCRIYWDSLLDIVQFSDRLQAYTFFMFEFWKRNGSSPLEPFLGMWTFPGMWTFLNPNGRSEQLNKTHYFRNIIFVASSLLLFHSIATPIKQQTKTTAATTTTTRVRTWRRRRRRQRSR